MIKNILVVDNDCFMLEFVSNLLSNKGCQVVTAENGLTALDILETFIPDVLFVDLIMPNIDGKKLCEIVRKKERLKNIFIVILSAVAAEEKENTTRYEADAYIAKTSLDKMGRHIIEVIDFFNLDYASQLLPKTIGFEGLHPRGITKELLSERRHFEMVLEIMCEGIMEISSEARIIHANPAALSLTKVAEEELLGSSFVKLFSPDDQKRIEVLLQMLPDKPEAITKDHPVSLNDSHVTVNISPIVDEEYTAVVVLNDITEIKRIEAEREKLIADLRGALAKVKTLSGLLPICSYCKKVRNDKGYWKQIENYLTEHSNAIPTHGICPECAKKYYPDLNIYDEQ